MSNSERIGEGGQDDQLLEINIIDSGSESGDDEIGDRLEIEVKDSISQEREEEPKLEIDFIPNENKEEQPSNQYLSEQVILKETDNSNLFQMRTSSIEQEIPIEENQADKMEAEQDKEEKDDHSNQKEGENNEKQIRINISNEGNKTNEENEDNEDEQELENIIALANILSQKSNKQIDDSFQIVSKKELLVVEETCDYENENNLENQSSQNIIQVEKSSSNHSQKDPNLNQDHLKKNQESNIELTENFSYKNECEDTQIKKEQQQQQQQEQQQQQQQQQQIDLLDDQSNDSSSISGENDVEEIDIFKMVQESQQIPQSQQVKKQSVIKEEPPPSRKPSKSELSICQAPQTIAQIFSQLSEVFSKMIIPQSIVNMSLLANQQISNPQFKQEASIQEQLNQLQNQVSFVQNSVIQIPTYLQEVTHLLGKTVESGTFLTHSQPIESTGKQQQEKNKAVAESKENGNGNVIPHSKKEYASSITKKEEIETSKKQIKNDVKKAKVKEVIQKKEDDDEDDNSDEDEEGNDSDEKSSSDEESSTDQEIMKELKSISQKFSSKPLPSTPVTSYNKKTSYFQPKIGFSTPKLIGGGGIAEKPQINHQEKEAEPNIVINAASIGFKEPKLFINESEKITKTEEIETEDEELKALFDYLNKFDSPTSFLLLKEQFPDIEDDQLHNTLEDFKDENKLGIIKLFLPKYSKCTSARIDYFYVDMIIPPPKPKEVPKPNEDKQEGIEQSQGQSIEIQNVGEKKKFESMSDEQLLSYQKELNLKKQSLLDKKQNANPTSERIKKIQQWNEMKEICSTVLERIAVLNGKTITEICDNFGIKLDV